MGKWGLQRRLWNSLHLRASTAKALHAYRQAEARFHELQQQKDALDAEERVILHIWTEKLSRASLRPGDHEGFQSAYLSLGQRRAELFESWQTANADLASAYEQARRVLREFGFTSPLDD
ncbi:hypothetical protein ILFOPFJJ_06058 [Ensifer psoraleae]|uniref:hypothetical protein n=1 Tax=Sinorhizobium psoraleae TaxID=520838 RepID=UPI000BE7B631|nr:hypothetical protein [Sinorhizobium psoraleae]NRP75135.1 hypothetical protein [Sinorhizobium psoraleae]